MKRLHIDLAAQLLLILAIAVACAQARPNTAAANDAAAATAAQSTPTPAAVHLAPVPTVSTVLANDTAIAHQFIDNLNLTAIPTAGITNRRLNSMPNNVALIGTVQTNSVVDVSAVVGASILTSSKPVVAAGNRAHHGIAVPMTMEELEAEMAAATPKPVSVKHSYRAESTTAKDGITTWIPADPTSTSTTAKPSLMAGVISQKQDKIAKVKVDNKTNKVKFVPSSPKGTTTPTTTSASTTTETSTTSASPTTTKPVTTKAPAIKKKAPTRPSPTRPSTTTSATTTTENVPTTTTESEVSTTTEEKVPFQILEPKEANFDLPEDRSPGKLPASTKKPKRPTKSNGKKKPLNKNKTAAAAAAAAAAATDSTTDLLADEVESKNSTKTAVSNLKNKQKPMSTQIYNYLSREIMPTVGVGLIGLVVTAGIAGYFLNPLGALRRSYEVADRKDDLYHYNNEEYAGVGTGSDGGQSEEEIFGKVIAGMPVHSTAQYRNNVRYVQQQQQQPAGPAPVQHRHPNHYRQYVGPGAAPQQYSRYRPGPMPPAGSAAHPGHYAAYAAHYGQQRNVQPAPLSPNVLVQKSIGAPMYASYGSAPAVGGGGVPVNPISRHSLGQQVAAAPQQAATYDASDAANVAINNDEQQQQQQPQQPQQDQYASQPASAPGEPTSSPSTPEAATTASTPLPSIVYSYTDKSYTDQYLDSNPSDLQRRSQFVVGSVVLADAQAAALTAADPAGKYPSIVLPEHGPRRRRRSLMFSDSESAAAASDDAVAEIVEGRTFDLNINEADTMYADLRRRYEAAAPTTRADKQLLKEMKRLDYQVVRLRRVIAEAKDIEQFQSELSLEPKNTELHEMLNNGLVQITSDIRFVGELLDDPKLAGEKMAERSAMSKRMALTKKHQQHVDRADLADVSERANEVKSAHSPTPAAPIAGDSTTEAAGTSTPVTYTHTIEYTTTARPSLLVGFLKMLELKSAFGVNVLRSIRPAFDRAVADVFRVNQTMYNHN